MIKSFQQNYIALILNKISMVSLKLLRIIDNYFSQTKNKANNDIIVLDGMTLIIVKRDFYQFFL